MDSMEMGSGGGSPPAEQEEADPGAMPHDEGAEGQMGILHISKDMLPAGMAEKVNKGDILEFRAVGTVDAEGDIPVEYNTGEGDEKKEPWEDEFRKEMSPRATKEGDAGMGESTGGNPGSGY